MKEGKFITIDGVEGAGKSTQIDFICSYLQEKGIEVVRTRELTSSNNFYAFFLKIRANKVNLRAFSRTFYAIYSDKLAFFHNGNFKMIYAKNST